MVVEVWLEKSLIWNMDKNIVLLSKSICFVFLCLLDDLLHLTNHMMKTTFLLSLCACQIWKCWLKLSLKRKSSCAVTVLSWYAKGKPRWIVTVLSWYPKGKNSYHCNCIVMIYWRKAQPNCHCIVMVCEPSLVHSPGPYLVLYIV